MAVFKVFDGDSFLVVGGGGGGGGGDTLPVVDTTSIAKGSVDDTKQVRFEVDGLTTGNVRVLTVPDKNLTIGDASQSTDPHGSTLTQSVAVNTPKIAHTDSILIDANHPTNDTVVAIVNSGAGAADLSVERDIIVAGLVDGEDIAALGQAVTDILNLWVSSIDYNAAHAILVTVTVGNPVSLVIGEDRVLGRLATENIKALTGAEVGSLIALTDLSDVSAVTGTGAVVRKAGPTFSGDVDFLDHVGMRTHTFTFASPTSTVVWRNSNLAVLTITSSVAIEFTDPLTNHDGHLTLKIIHGNAGLSITSWDSDIIWPDGVVPTLSSGSGDIDILSFLWEDGKYHGIGNFNFRSPP